MFVKIFLCFNTINIGDFGLGVGASPLLIF